MAHSTWTCYDSNGKILMVVEGDEEQAKVNGDGYIEADSNPETQYISSGSLTSKPANPASIDGNVLSDVLAGSNITVKTSYDVNSWTNVDAGEHTIELPVDNMYIKVSVHGVFPYLDFVYERS